MESSSVTKCQIIENKSVYDIENRVLYFSCQFKVLETFRNDILFFIHLPLGTFSRNYAYFYSPVVIDIVNNTILPFGRLKFRTREESTGRYSIESQNYGDFVPAGTYRIDVVLKLNSQGLIG